MDERTFGELIGFIFVMVGYAIGWYSGRKYGIIEVLSQAIIENGTVVVEKKNGDKKATQTGDN